MKVLVTGASGNVGSYVVKELLKMGENVVVAGTDIKKLINMFGDKVDVVEFDFTKKQTFKDALNGVDRIFLMRPPHVDKEVQLIYIDSSEEYVYKEEFDNASRVFNVKTIYLVNREDLNEKIGNFVKKYKNEAEYYIVGSKLMINFIDNLLMRKGVKKKNIRRDRFVGL
jgi:Na+-transporting NADH:ubiquinone oxidoreductase subunit NqrF